LQNCNEGLVFSGKHSSMIMAIIISSLYFSLLHIENCGFTVQYFISLIIFGLVVGASVMATGSLGLAIGFHFSYNFFLTCVFGYEWGRFSKDFPSIILSTYYTVPYFSTSPPVSFSELLWNGLLLSAIPLIFLWARFTRGTWIQDLEREKYE